ncbi:MULTISPECIES: hypothetical protein [unclassified Kitasatospora]|uniref:hypothetical protein n=1 Tax=unclassified Kitasatospora TaxID=2633591 RepID=UPI000708F04F|nr:MULTISPECIES: hypothetical protein [unclassified Kitasatospora]KQV14292.1 hypothetical protein ASC99_32005 [Kitasatospora sp. Root107]KRB72374.1 hypothetical protein ASE03_22900 [Kitasatospora sp. Root187]
MLREHAGPADQWIVDELDDPPERCPRADLSNMLVLDSDGRDRAYALWLVDDVDVCVVAITRDERGSRGQTVLYGPIDELADRAPILIGLVQHSPAMLAVFPGIDSGIVLKGDEPRTFHPASSRTVVLGPGRVVTFAVSRFAVPYQGAPLGLDLALCPVRDGECRPMYP